MLTTLIVVASIELLDLGDSGVGLLNAAVGLGGLIGAVGAIGLTRIPAWRRSSRSRSRSGACRSRSSEPGRSLRSR